MHGEKVIVRAFGGEPLVRVIWDTAPEVAYICTEEGYKKLLAHEHWIPVGFPREDVFCYDPTLMNELLELWSHEPSVWERLMIWREEHTEGGHPW